MNEKGENAIISILSLLQNKGFSRKFLSKIEEILREDNYAENMNELFISHFYECKNEKEIKEVLSRLLYEKFGKDCEEIMNFCLYPIMID